MTRINYREGDWFAVPLQDSGFAVGVIARANSKAALLGYFFGPRRSEISLGLDCANLSAADAVLVSRFGHLRLLDGAWPLIGQVPGWDRNAWPMPVFERHEELTGRWFQVFYHEDDPAKLLGERQFVPASAERGPQDGLMGAGFVEQRLTRLLGRSDQLLH
ncbi:MAG: immunity 26/phosphotriesterase HocA family protein [Chloroflexota bacterium]